MRTALIFGGSGQIGRPLLRRLVHGGWRLLALSREPRAGAEGVTWLRGGFDALPALPARVDAVISAGPLDAFARWYARTGVRTDRVVAFGSTSVEVKQDSVDAAERDVARRLREGEATVLATASARGTPATLLRPTLVYGAGRDATLTRIAALASRWGRFPLPRGANGLRQPVHVDDLAAVAVACIDAPASFGRVYALPGGETLPYREMVARVLASLQPPARLVELPSPVFSLALHAARLLGRAPGEAVVARMREDLVFDAAPAQRDLGYAPRPFKPTPQMFGRRT
ncbi:NAD-dependent epimerase/dehydratase family protein [Marilutibacter alkalisoli]|uniref:Nucleoside-diphosphate sugar epimerase n=1 Tax=Marilutibacter alkalisoli TaxID=2591633 RepID=A0A514BUN5_9GAMM|nr:NAD-dependent epimerase/dehydratase family protein [Lysobacter alkalisoli]QDH71076.1 nucleoside-diphosphate sugar epimerase [Lysobacter alkalisoli]